MRFLILFISLVLPGVSHAGSQVQFRNEIAINAHTYLVQVAAGERELAAELAALKSVNKIVESYTEEVKKPRFHLMFARGQVPYITSILINSGSLSESDCPALCKQLQDFLPLYRATLWPQQQRKNQTWINQLSELQRDFGHNIETELNNYFATDIIPSQHTVFVVGQIDKGATTSGRQPVSIMSSEDPEQQGWYALEILFHEIAHTYGTSRRSPLSAQINASYGEQKPSPRDLWHVIHFYTVGYTVQQQLKKASVDYTPYAQTIDLYSGRWQPAFAKLKQHWLPYLQGKVTMQQALAEMQTQ